MSKTYWVYIMSNKKHGTLYVGVTNDLAKRIGEHREGQGSEYVRKWGLRRLVHAEAHQDIEQAILREKRLKKWRRQWKIDLITASNPEWDDLSDQLHLANP